MHDDRVVAVKYSRFPIVDGVDAIETIEDLLRKYGFFTSNTPSEEDYEPAGFIGDC